jgi:hypothetical protein
MRTTTLALAVAALAVAPLSAGPRGSVTGDYVEVRTADIFTGGCIMGSQGEWAGRQALLAWRVSSGTFDGVALDGLAVVAAVAADTNLGFHEHGGQAPTVVKAALMVDGRATPAQHRALVALARTLGNGLVSDVVEVRSVPISFVRDDQRILVAAGDARLAVGTQMEHDSSCNAMQWFQPLTPVAEADMGLTHVQAYSGAALGTKWRQADRRSAFFGTFSFR